MICKNCGFHFWGASFCPWCKTDVPKEQKGVKKDG